MKFIRKLLIVTCLTDLFIIDFLNNLYSVAILALAALFYLITIIIFLYHAVRELNKHNYSLFELNFKDYNFKINNDNIPWF